MGGIESAVAQLVMKREDGQSILTSGAITAENAGMGDLDEARVDEIRLKLEGMGFEVVTGNLNTLSIAGPDDLFEDMFGLSPTMALSANVPAHSTKLPEDLEPFVADVFVAPRPQTFP